MPGANEYLIPFGVDPRPFFEGLNKMDAGVEQLGANVQQAGKEIQGAFTGAANSADVLGKRLDVDAQKALGLRDQAKSMGKEIGNALNGKDVGAGLEDRISKVKKLFEGVGSGKAAKLNVDFDEAKLEHFESLIKSGANEFKVLGEVVSFAKAKLDTLNPDSQEWKALAQEISVADEFLARLGDTSDKVEQKDKSLKAQLRELKAELAAMEIAGKETTDTFLKMSVRAGQLEDQIGDISQRVRVLASDTKYIDAGIQAITGLAGAFAAAQGASALFGSENEAVNEVIKKVTGATALLQGVQAVANALNKDSALSVLFLSRARTADTVALEAETVATTAEAGASVAATAATRSFTAALLANPITLIVVALVAAVSALLAFGSGSKDAEEAADKLNKTLERQNELLKLDEGGINRRTALTVAQIKADAELAKSRTKSATEQVRITSEAEAKVTKIEGLALAQRTNLRIDNLNETRALLSDRDFVEKLSSEKYKELQQKELEQSEDVANLTNELNIKRVEMESQGAKSRADIQKASIEEAKKAAEKRKAILEQEIKWRREFTSAYIDSIKDQYDKEREQAKANTGQKIEDLQREKVLSSKAEKERNDVIAILRQNLTAQLKEIDRKREADRATLLFEGQQKLAELQKEGTAKDLELSRLSYEQRVKEINDQFKNEGALRLQLLTALAAKRKADEKKINDQAAANSLKEQEDRAVLEVETASKFIGNLPHLEEKKQIEVLKVKIDYAQRNMDLLLKQGNAEDSVAVLQAKKQVQELKKALGDATKDLNKKEGTFSLFDALGLGTLTEEQKASVQSAAKSMLDSVSQITSFIVDQYQQQINARQKVIDADNKAVDDLENQLEKEKQLREEGLANNVDTIQAELDEKKRQREEDLKAQEELQKKQQAIQRVQLALDTATQASSLITSAANIFKSLSSIPVIGVPLAIATIALMVGAFTTAKIKAFQAISGGQKQSFAGGGWIDGKPHSQGGKKYFAADGSGDVVELEGEEHVTRKEQAAKYGDLLDAINNDSLSGMTGDALREMLHEMGIHLTDNEAAEGLTMVRERDQLRTELVLLPGQDISGDIKQINHGVTYMAEREKQRPDRWFEDGYYYTSKGNKITKTRAKQ